MSLQNRVAIVTGATGNLGRVVAKQLAEAGARLALVGTDAERLRQLAGDLKLPADQVLLHPANLRDSHAARGLVQAVTEKFSRVDILTHLVGGWAGGKTVAEFTAAETEEMLQQHLWTTWYLAQAVGPVLAARGWGRILVISSPLATHPAEKGAPYAIAKAAQETLLLTLAQELRGSGVTANVLQVKAIDAQHERDAKRSPKNAAWTTPEEIAAAILYLCSEPAQTINGARIPLFGGPA
jgi:NAD(P)-dependent dehydrogenase (short-subunit alcohol dehydrogenase family)